MNLSVIKSGEAALKSAFCAADCDNTVADIVEASAEIKVLGVKAYILGKGKILA